MSRRLVFYRRRWSGRVGALQRLRFTRPATSFSESPHMPDKRKSSVVAVPARTLEELLKASKRLADRAAQAGRELNEIAEEMEATQREIEKRLKEQGRTLN